MGMIRIKVR